MYRLFFKRIIDISLSMFFIFLFWWLYIVVAILIRKKLGSPVIFKQQRPGLNEKVFTMYKFRTMTDRKDEYGNLLPELWNVLRGEMSLVGPRPLLVEYLSKYTKNEKRRHEVRPGITGYAQVNGRNNTSWEDRFKNDIYYVENISFLLDMKIIIKTFLKVIEKSDINQSDDITMKNFLDEK